MLGHDPGKYLYHMYDIVLISVPYTIVESPPLGIAVLKGAVESYGFKCLTLDLGLELLKDCNHDRSIFDSLQEYFSTPDMSIDPDAEFLTSEFIEKWAVKLSALDTTWIGISVFSYYSHLATYMLCEKIKQLNPKIKIVIGGPAVGVQMVKSMHAKYHISSTEKLLKFGDILLRRKLIDENILGDGEQALVDLLNGCVEPDVFHMEKYQHQDHPYANFDDFELGLYTGQLNRGHTQLPIFSSKGCVRSCDFCDVTVVQNKFRFRSGLNIVKEMIYLAERHGIRDFIFLDSLVNGSMKSLREWVTELARFNRENPDKKITWSASGWICRPIGQMPLDLYPLLAESGLASATIGVESGSNNVLLAMNKKTTVEALYFEAEQFQKNNIHFITLLMVGHWSETWEDFLKTISMVYKISSYARTGHLVAVSPGGTFELGPDTPADLNYEKNQLQRSAAGNWWTELNPNLTAKERFYRLLLLEKFLHRLRIPLMEQTAGIAHTKLANNFSDYQTFYPLKVHGKELAQCAEYYYENFDEFLNLVLSKETASVLKLEFELESSVTHDNPPVIEIKFNQQTIYKSGLSEGTHQISLSATVTDARRPWADVWNKLEMLFSNKSSNDTIVDNNGHIVKDKFVLLKKFSINGIDLFADHDFFYKKLKYHTNGVATDVHPGFWHNNSAVSLEFDNPFLLWYHANTNHFAQFDGFIVTESTMAKTKSLTKDDYTRFRAEAVKLLKQLEH
jgi:hypothetical protein